MSRARDLANGVTTFAPLASPAFTGTPTGITKAHVGLGNVDNVADASQTSLGTVTSGTIGSGATIQQKTALLTGESTGDLNPVDDGANHYTLRLTTEADPYNFVTLSSNTVTVTEAGKYHVSWNTGKLIAWIETLSSSYVQSYLEKGGTTDIKKGDTTIVVDIYDTANNAGPMTSSKGNWIGDLSANDTLKVRIYTAVADFELKSWTGITGSGANNIFSHMLIEKIG